LKILLIIILTLTFTDLYAYKIVDDRVELEGLDGYSRCMSRDVSGNWCQEALERWVKKNKEDYWQAGILTRQHMNSWLAIPFFYEAQKSKQFDCQNENLILAIKEAYKRPKSEIALVKKAHHLAFKVCLSSIRKELQGALPGNSDLFDEVCHDFKKEDLLTRIGQLKCK
jgi:hypothetical protein